MIVLEGVLKPVFELLVLPGELVDAAAEVLCAQRVELSAELLLDDAAQAFFVLAQGADFLAGQLEFCAQSAKAGLRGVRR